MRTHCAILGGSPLELAAATAALRGAGIVAALLFFLAAGSNVRAALPPDFPSLTITTNDPSSVASGYVFLEVTDSATNGGYYVMILDNTGTPVWYRNVTNHNFDFKVLPNGYLHYADVYHGHSWTDGGDCVHRILNDSYNPSETIQATNGYVADAHDFQLLPNGHALVIGYYKTQIDMSKYAVGGKPDALVGGAIIQELDANRNVVFQWRSWDHFTVPGYFPSATFTNGTATNSFIDAFHLNTVVMDNDGNLLVSNFGMDVWKINRQSGDIMWRLGGTSNQFSFVGVDPQQALGHFSGHTLSRLDNGNILIYCNADQAATRSSKVYEYRLDETNKVATLVWSYTPPTNYYAWHYGSAQRLANSNTFVGWGKADFGATNQAIPACTEIAPDGRIVFQLKFNDPKVSSYRAYRFVYPPSSQDIVSWYTGIEAGNHYDFDQTGVSADILDGGDSYNQLTVTRQPYAPIIPDFDGKAPRVLPVRVQVTQWNIFYMQMNLYFDAVSFGFTDPNNLTVYSRSPIGQGQFEPLPTAYNPVTGKLGLEFTISGTSEEELIFGYPDVSDVAHPPILTAAENYRGVQPYGVIGPLPAATGSNYFVNQQLPVSLAWSPKGLAGGGYRLQIATNSSFASPIVDVPTQLNAAYVWSNAAPGSAYFYRVNATNDAGASVWSVGAFQTVPLKITGIYRDATGNWALDWTGPSSGVYVEFTPTLAPAQWQSLAGPLSGFSWTNTAAATPAGFYRLRL